MTSIGSKQRSEDTLVHDTFSHLMESLSQIATRRRRQDILSSFCDKYLNFFLSQQVAINASPEAMFDVLAQAVDIREELHDIERRMDKEHFTELLVGGYFAYGGIDKKESIPICWTRSGLVEHESKSSEAGRMKYSTGSPRALAFLRAYIFYFEVATAQALSCTDTGNFAVYLNESDRRVIDFNPTLSREFFRLLSAMFPATAPRIVIVAGGILAKTLFNMMKAWCPRMNLEAYDVIASCEVYDLVGDPDDVPAFWLGDGSGRVPSHTNRRHLWCYERCLQDEGKITTRDLFNPGPWLYPEEEAAAVEDMASVSSALGGGRCDKESSSLTSDGPGSFRRAGSFAVGLPTIRENSNDGDW